jgi:TonB family protein
MTANKDSKLENLSPGLRISMALHVGAIVFILLKSLFFPSSPTPYIPVLKVDLIGLPDQIKPEPVVPPAAQEKSAPVAEKPAVVAQKDEISLKKNPKPHPTPVVKKTDEKISNALARIKALERIKSDVSRQSTTHKGNQLSAGSSSTGETRESLAATYYDSVMEMVRSRWALPVWLARQNLQAQVQVHLDSQGRVQNLRWIKNSGNTQFDEAVKKTIMDSEPFAIPPPELKGSLLSQGILLGFPL